MTTQNFVTLPREVVDRLVQSLEFYLNEAGIENRSDPHYAREDYEAFDAAKAGGTALTVQAQPAQGERNFCERCGKRAYDGIHTCTPPQSKPCRDSLVAGVTGPDYLNPDCDGDELYTAAQVRQAIADALATERERCAVLSYKAGMDGLAAAIRSGQ